MPAGLSSVVAIEAGGLYSLALKADGTVVCWGDNSENHCTNASSLTNVKAISAGNTHSLALHTDGSVTA